MKATYMMCSGTAFTAWKWEINEQQLMFAMQVQLDSPPFSIPTGDACKYIHKTRVLDID